MIRAISPLLGVLRIAGPRHAELAALDLADLDRSSLTLRMMGKGRTQRRAHVAQTRPELEAWLVVRGEALGPLFCAVRKVGAPKTGAPLAESGIAWILARLARLAEIAHVSPHDIRRTFVRDLLDAGADLTIVKRLVGHAQMSTTQRHERR